MYLLFRAEFAAGTWRRNSYILWVELNLILALILDLI
jgi:hypothetical protein